MIIRDRIFLKALALTYLTAFSSLFFQLKGLYGSRGILPIKDLIQYFSGAPADKFFKIPTLFWINSGDLFITSICGLGIIVSVALLFQRKAALEETLYLLILYSCYLSFVSVGRDFLSFQWDILLLETGFWAILYYACKTQHFAAFCITWIFRLLIFKVMFMSGLVKLSSGDTTWANLTALNYHYYTQPLPNPFSYWIYQMPEIAHRISCLIMFAIELILPWAVFMGARMCMVAALGFMTLQLVIISTGNYCFFNLLNIFLCFWLIDDKYWERFLPKILVSKIQTEQILNREDMFMFKLNERILSLNQFPKLTLNNVLILFLSTLILVINLSHIISRAPLDQALRISVYEKTRVLNSWFQSFYIANPYGLFAVMTTSRHEIIIQGGTTNPITGTVDWKDYKFKYKPDDVYKLPAQIAPHQPRLDWQMWFAALSNYQSQPWFINLCLRLFEGSPDVLGLLAYNPFPDRAPEYIRALVYDYKFTNLNDLYTTNAIWKRELIGNFYLQPIKNPSF